MGTTRVRVAGVLAGVVIVALAGAAVLLVDKGSAEAPPIVFAPQRSPTYGEPRALEGSGVYQTVTVRRDAEELALGVRSYPNPAGLTAEQWIRANWDPRTLLVLEPVSFAVGAGVRLVTADEWIAANEGELDFPMLVALRVGDRIVVVDRANGAPIDDVVAFELLAEARVR